MHSEEAKVYIAILIAAGILGVLLILFILSTLAQQKKHQQLHTEKINAEINTLENERKRVARDLHDEVAMLLSVAKLELSAIENGSAHNQPLLIKANAHIDSAISKIRDIVRNLMPVTLERKGLVPALDEFFAKLNTIHTLTIDYSFPKHNIQLSKTMQIQVYRVVQEIVHNALKHAEASQIIFVMRQYDRYIELHISDNGKGFNQGTILKQNSGLGLHNISSRVEMINGDIYLQADEGTGVNYTIKIPTPAI